MRVSVFRKAHFNAAHRLHNPNWSVKKNRQIYGLCNHSNYHGHNYELTVRVTGDIDPDSGYLIDMKILKEIIRVHIEEKFDHQNLNLDIPEFLNTIPTSENFVIIIWKILREQIDDKLDLMVRLYETPRNYVEFPAHD